MKYISGQHALNLPCSLETCGDWHQSALQWTKPFMRESDGSIFGDYGIEGGIVIPEHTGTYYVANHIRALLDLLELKNFPLAQGMRQNFICNDAYTPEIFEQVSKLRTLPHWTEIDRFMGREYCGAWLKYKESMGMAPETDVPDGPVRSAHGGMIGNARTGTTGTAELGCLCQLLFCPTHAYCFMGGSVWAAKKQKGEFEP